MCILLFLVIFSNSFSCSQTHSHIHTTISHTPTLRELDSLQLATCHYNDDWCFNYPDSRMSMLTYEYNMRASMKGGVLIYTWDLYAKWSIDRSLGWVFFMVLRRRASVRAIDGRSSFIPMLKLEAGKHERQISWNAKAGKMDQIQTIW